MHVWSAWYARQVVGDAAGINVPASLRNAWTDACASRSKKAKTYLFQSWIRAGGDWNMQLA